MLAMFSDYSAVMWNVETFDAIWKIEMNEPSSSLKLNTLAEFCLHTFVFNHDGSYMLACVNNQGEGNYGCRLLVWDVDSKSLIHDVDLDTLVDIKSVSKFLVIPKTNVCAVNGVDGQIHFIDFMTCTVIPGSFKNKLVWLFMLLDY